MIIIVGLMTCNIFDYTIAMIKWVHFMITDDYLSIFFSLKVNYFIISKYHSQYSLDLLLRDLLSMFKMVFDQPQFKCLFGC